MFLIFIDTFLCKGLPNGSRRGAWRWGERTKPVRAEKAEV
jgi:hypothetical protein